MRLMSASSELERTAAPDRVDRLMWVTPDRVFYVGLLGSPSTRIMGSLILYVAAEGPIRVRIDGGDWQVTEMAVVPPYVPHEVLAEARLINVIKIEAETVDLAAMPELLRQRGAVAAEDFVARTRMRSAELRTSRRGDLMSIDFDQLFFEQTLAPRRNRPPDPGGRRHHQAQSVRPCPRGGLRPGRQPVVFAIPSPVQGGDRDPVPQLPVLEAGSQLALSGQ